MEGSWPSHGLLGKPQQAAWLRLPERMEVSGHWEQRRGGRCTEMNSVGSVMRRQYGKVVPKAVSSEKSAAAELRNRRGEMKKRQAQGRADEGEIQGAARVWSSTSGWSPAVLLF